MDQEAELQRFKWVFTAFAFFVVSLIFSVNEFRYAVWGRTTDATFLDANKTGTRRDRQIVVDYRFKDTDGKTRTEYDFVSRNWPLSDSPTISVQYIPAKPGKSRLTGNSQMVPVYFFVGSVVFLVASAGVLWRKSKK